MDRSKGGRSLAWKPVTYLGMISYGLYVYHWPIYRLVWMQPIPATLLSIALASLSWYLYEKPINSLKRHFNYPRPVKAQRTTSGLREEVGNAVVPLSGVGSYN